MSVVPPAARRLLAAPCAARRRRALLVAPARATTPRPTATPAGSSRPAAPRSDNDDPGEKVVIGFSGPAADHGWLAAITNSAEAEAEKYEDVELRAGRGHQRRQPADQPGRDLHQRQVDAIVLLPIDGAALTDVAIKAMEAGIPVINVDREFSSPFAARATILGDNYGMGVSRRHVHLRAAQGDRASPTRSSPRSPASTRCR